MIIFVTTMSLQKETEGSTVNYQPKLDQASEEKKAETV